MVRGDAATAACACQISLEQRARLLAAVWDDAHADQRAVRHGAMPAWLLAQAGQGRSPLEHYAADLVCCPDGVWRVARDHVEPHPGACLLEAPALAAFLPGLCRLLLGETLRLPSVPTWWLGEPHIWPALAANGRRFAVRAALDRNGQAINLGDLPPLRRQALQAMVDADPREFVAGLNLGPSLPVRHVIYGTTRACAVSYC